MYVMHLYTHVVRPSCQIRTLHPCFPQTSRRSRCGSRRSGSCARLWKGLKSWPEIEIAHVEGTSAKDAMLIRWASKIEQKNIESNDKQQRKNRKLCMSLPFHSSTFQIPNRKKWHGQSLNDLVMSSFLCFQQVPPPQKPPWWSDPRGSGAPGSRLWQSCASQNLRSLMWV